MKTTSTRYPNLVASHRHLLLVMGVSIALVALASVAFLSTAASSGRSKVASPKSSNLPSSNKRISNFFPSSKVGLPNLTLVAETIDTFAADCSTPKAAFTLGEAVCAKTDDVDLGFAGGRWVHWLRQDLSIAYGGSGTTPITSNPQFFSFVPDQVGTWKVTIAETGDDSQTPAAFTVTQAPESIATYDATCTFAKDHFNSGETICAIADDNFTGTRYIYWVDDEGTAIQVDAISPTNPSATRMFTETGNFWVYLSDEESLRSKHRFTVSNPSEPEVDLSIFKNRHTSTDVVAGGFVTYEIVVGNRGPDTASTVELTDVVPLNTSYVTSTQDSGPAFTKTQDSPTTTWQIASLPAGVSASFTFVYQVVGGTPVGTVISNTVVATTTTDETHTPDNSSTSEGTVVGGGGGGDCVLDCPNDIVTSATTHGVGGGANVTFGAAEGFGNCGAITNNPTSGSFFPIGTTTVTSTSATGGGGCSFSVTVVDTAAPTISCPGNMTVTANPGESGAFVPNPNGSSSNVGMPATTGDAPLEVSGSREDGEALTAKYPFGTTNITWIATDPSGRQATCTQTVTVIPDHILTISCPADASGTAPNCIGGATVNPGMATANSGTATITSSRSDNLPLSDPYPVGTTVITWTASDTDTQVVSCTQNVNVSGGDTTPPVLNVPANVSVTTSTCSATLDEELGVATADDDCGTVNITRTGIPQIPCPIPGNPTRTCDSFVFPTGTTIITYTATNSSGLSTTGTQTVTVTESPAVPPTIVLNGPNPQLVECHTSYTELGATATDNCSGSFPATPSGSVNVNVPGDYTITYNASDGSGNAAAPVTRTVRVQDTIKPVITVNGADPATVECHTSYTDAGATAADSCDTSVPVTTTGSVDVNTVGTYTLTYNATDDSGNAADAVTRTVNVVDTTLPTITLNSYAPSMWPPNHKYKTFQLTQFVTGASDSCDLTIDLNDVVIEKVTSDELENSGGDGNTLNDIVIAANCKSVQLRSERRGGGDGRVYTITFKVTDASGRIGRATATVVVPHNPGGTVVDSGVNYTVNCP